MKKLSFVAAMKDYFGLREGTSNIDFLHEMKALADTDKVWFRTNLATVGYEIITI